MRIATWNINGLQARLDYLLGWLEKRQPDVLGLQELKLPDERFPKAVFEDLGYRCAIHGQKSWNGVALLSRQSLQEVRLDLPGQEYMGARLIQATTSGITIVNLYCPNGKHRDHPDFERKLAWLDALILYLQQGFAPDSRLIVAGDFNLCPQPLDSWNEEGRKGSLFHTNEERSRFRRLQDWGLHDLYRSRHPERQAFSWWDYRAGAFHRNRGLRIDFLLATRPLARQVEEIEIDRDYRKKIDGLTPSDHAPVMARLGEPVSRFG